MLHSVAAAYVKRGPQQTEAGAARNDTVTIVPVRIDAKGPYDFVLDTGATISRAACVSCRSSRCGSARPRQRNVMTCAFDLSNIRQLGLDVGVNSAARLRICPIRHSLSRPMVDKPLVWLHGEVTTPPFSKDARIEAGELLSGCSAASR